LLKCLGWPAFIKSLQHPIDISPTIHRAQHPAAPYLHRLANNGVPAPSKAQPWTLQQKKAVLTRGAHSSATQQFRDFLWEDMADMITKGFWSVLLFQQIKSEKDPVPQVISL
jgi:hypothetical protein